MTNLNEVATSAASELKAGDGYGETGVSATLDGNEAAVRIAYQLSEVMAIYPITPSTPMGEQADAWAANNQTNLWGNVPQIIEMQSEGGVAGALHGAMQTGALTSTFTASQGLLLMIPNMYKIAGELTPTVFHVTARSLAAQGLSIFGDHSDVMAVRQSGFALLCAASVQESHDMALIAHAATLESRVPFVHFFDGFRTSHEINKIELINPATLRAMIDDRLVRAHRDRALSPDHPFIRGTAQNPDVYFQARETVNPFYQACPSLVQKTMDKFGALTGRHYHLFDYVGAPDAQRVVVAMGSGAETVEQTVKYLISQGEKVGMVKVRLFRPFDIQAFCNALPPSVQKIAVLDRTKEPGSAGEPLYLDVVAALHEYDYNVRSAIQDYPLVVGGRYGLASKEFTPAMVKGIFDELEQAKPKNHFTIGIHDDVTNTSLDFDPEFSIEDNRQTVSCVFWGLGSDGTVGANKNSIKIIGEQTPNYAQGYFVYDSKKSGSVTISHLRFGAQPIHAPYLISRADFVACHQFNFLERLDVLKSARPGAVFLLNSPYGPATVWSYLPREVQQTISGRRLRFYVIDALRVAQANKMSGRINTIMQTCFFAISGVLPREQAIAHIKRSIEKSYAKRGETVVRQNWQAVDDTLAHLYQVAVPQVETGSLHRRPSVDDQAPTFVREVLGTMLSGNGDSLPVSALPCDGTYPSGTAQWEKRNIGLEIPDWNSDICIQCGKCVLVCPHAVIRHKVYEAAYLQNAPSSFVSVPARFKEFGGDDWQYTLQISPEDCTGCGLCVEACPVKDKQHAGRKAINMVAQSAAVSEPQKTNWNFFAELPEVERPGLGVGTIKNSQLLQPLFEFSGACSGCGETPYVKLVSQLFGDRALIANATGCSSIYGGNLPTTPWTFNRKGRGPAWANSLFEDNAEFGLGMRLSLDQQESQARALLNELAPRLETTLVQELLAVGQTDRTSIEAQRARVAQLRTQLAPLAGTDERAANLLSLSDNLVKKSVWIIGGDGWAYDIGFGGLDHVLASGHNVNVLVLDTEVYSNTGGQSSKATPRAAIAKFAALGKSLPKKDLGMLAMSYGYIYVARVAIGADDQQTLTALLEAEAYDGPSLVIAYSHCIAHGIDMRQGLAQQKLATQTGYWPLYRFNPAKVEKGQNPFVLDSKAPSISFASYSHNETRYQLLAQTAKERAESLMKEVEEDIARRWQQYQHLVALWQPANGE
jgi:pyruvate-ferredoxin/flavodoxin oxidoreductase